ncbi:MAG: VWA domain-containing protein, partial [Chloroflexota bacterium]
MAAHHYRYSLWDGSQEVPDFSADDILENMADDLLRGGDPERALRNLLRRGFRLPDGRRFEGLQRLLRQMRQQRQEMTTRYDPNGLVEDVRQKLEQIERLERDEIQRRREPEVPDGAEQTGPEGASSETGGQGGQPDGGESPQSAARGGEAGSGSSGHQSGDSGGSGQAGDAGQAESDTADFQQMLERMLDRREQQLDALAKDNAGKIHGLREYDFLSQPARQAFEELVGGMQRELMEQYFQGLKQGIGNISPEQMNGTRQMVQDLNQMLEDTRAGDREAFDRFMDKHRDYFPPGIESLDDLLQHLQRQMSAMQSLLESMTPEQRAELEAMMEELLRDDRLRLDLARLGANLSAMGFAPDGHGFSFRGGEAPGFGQSLDMMRRLQAMEDLENAIAGGDPFNAMAAAGGQQPGELFGPGLGSQIEAVKDMAESLLEAGYLAREGDRLELTARAVRKLGDASLREIFRKLKDDRSGGHVTSRKGQGGDITLESREYQFGDPFHIDIKATVMNGVLNRGPRVPVQLHPDDFAVFETENAVQHATVLALDMSHSMYLSGLFLEAKKTALALDSLIRGQFPRDALYLVGFSD